MSERSILSYLMATWLMMGCAYSAAPCYEDPRPPTVKEASQRAPDADVSTGSVGWGELPLCERQEGGAPPSTRVQDSLESSEGPARELSRVDINRAFNREVSRIISCYELLPNGPVDRQGRWLVRFIVNSRGAVERAAVVDFRPVDAGGRGATTPQFESCIVRVFCGVRFPENQIRRSVRVTYPLHLDFVE